MICDPPYGARTHTSQRHGRRDEKAGSQWVSARGIGYASMTVDDVREFVGSWSPRCRGWMAVFCCSDLASAWRSEMEVAGRYAFAPIACVQVGMNVRLAGDGPSNWTTWLVVSRPRTMRHWGTLPGAYIGNPFEPGENTATAGRRMGVVGSKPAWLMRAIIGDYTRPGQIVCDPCSGGGTTLLAAYQTGRRAIGAELDPATHAKAQARLDRALAQPHLFDPGLARAVQERLV